MLSEVQSKIATILSLKSDVTERLPKGIQNESKWFLGHKGNGQIASKCIELIKHFEGRHSVSVYHLRPSEDIPFFSLKYMTQ